MRNLLKHIWHMPRNLIASGITLYQAALSPDHGPLKHFYPYGFCPQEPTCSEYGKRVIRERGALLGLLFTAKRILSCHPWKEPRNPLLNS